MPRYTNTPPKDPRGYALPIIRTPAAKTLRAIITSPDIVGCNTHFWGGHTVPCDLPECEPCRNGVPYRWHAYCSIYIPNTALHFLYETTALGAEVLVQFRKRFSTLRGCCFEAYRWHRRPNGRVILRCEDTLNPEDALPPPPDLEKVLAIIWQLPIDAVSKSTPSAIGKHVEIDRKPLNGQQNLPLGEPNHEPPRPPRPPVH